MGLAGAALPWALPDTAWRSRASVGSVLSFACSSAVIEGFSRLGGRSSTGKYFCCGNCASARASINDELELAQPPSERLDNSTALTVSAVTCPLTCLSRAKVCAEAQPALSERVVPVTRPGHCKPVQALSSVEALWMVEPPHSLKLGGPCQPLPIALPTKQKR
jgi:hypothetical protein